ncbi:MAG: single-stranded DNA-binding protein [Eubacteriales bacterium]|nr:single-stranded DNA-binding protein [Eubacteriales bacterium]
MSDMNNLSIVGRLTADPELKYTNNGKSVCSFGIANNQKFGEKENISFFNCVAWGKTGETISKYCKKGHRVGLTGQIVQDRWESEGQKKSVVKINVSGFMFLQDKKDEPRNVLDGEEVDSAPQITENPFDDGVPF